MKLKKILSVLLSVLLLAALLIPAVSAETRAEEARLHFREDGSFRILNFSDIQDDAVLSLYTKRFIERSVKTYQPDLIILTGDNIAGYSTKNKNGATRAIRQYMDIFEKLGVPVAIVFGNHDDQDTKMSKEEQMALYNTYSCSVSVDDGPEIDGCGTYNVPIYSSNGDGKVKFNIWMIDSGTYDEVNGGYDHVKDSQLDWYRETSARLAAENGGPVPSMAFQHIIVPEIYDALEETDDPEGAIAARGTYYKLPETAAEGSILGEGPCPGTVNNGEFQAFLDGGDVLACVFGHDHVNSFVIPYQGIDLINTPTCGFSSYGNAETRGMRVIDLNEEDNWTYETFVVRFEDLMEKDPLMPFYQMREFFVRIGDWFERLFDRIKAAFHA